jgi:type IV pilus biogenesis protein CpaD/CtpE
MARAASVLAVLALVVAAGCLTTQPAAPEPVENPSVDLPYDDRTVGEAPSEVYDNPWQTEEIVVTVDHRGGGDRNVVPEVMRTVQYWENETESDADAAYEPDYRVVSEHEEPDLRVAVVRTVEGCGVHEDDVALGCAPVLTEESHVDGTVTVQVRGGHAPNTTEAVLKHEFGHTLGYRHGDEPAAVMSTNLSARAPADVVDARNRTYPWASETLSVAPSSDAALRDGQRDRLAAAVSFLSDGADGTIQRPPSVTVAEDAAAADVVVSFRKDAACEGVDTGEPSSSCVDWQGPDVDDDGGPEYYTGAHVVLGEAAHERPGWHVGYWLGQTLWTDRVPAPFYGWDHPPATEW